MTGTMLVPGSQVSDGTGRQGTRSDTESDSGDGRGKSVGRPLPARRLPRLLLVLRTDESVEILVRRTLPRNIEDVHSG